MRGSAIAVLVLTMLTAATPQTKRRPSRPVMEASATEQKARAAEDRAAIEELQRKDIAASMASDVDALLSLWTDDGVLLAPQHGPISGRAALRKFYEQQRDATGNAEILGYEEQWQEVRVMGKYAYQWGQIHARMRTGQSRAESSTLVNAMRILQRAEDGTWRVARAIYNEAQSSTSVGKEQLPEGERR
ncbi:MAG: SgcJ/EcaC family oxidoreductase [Acidobacteriia bacterium]|nr:SgcJ/EcaC family oxidoreductase [Terriglobia bacterium]